MGWAADGAVELVEAAMDWTVGNRARVVDELDAFDAALRDAATLVVEEGHADVPLAEHRSAHSPAA